MSVEHQSAMAPEPAAPELAAEHDGAAPRGPAATSDSASQHGPTGNLGSAPQHGPTVAHQLGAAHDLITRRERTGKGRTLAAEQHMGHLFEAIERLLVYLVAFLLIVFAVMSVVNTVTEVTGNVLSRQPDVSDAITKGIDGAFLAVILLELLHTVLSRGPLSRQLQEFLVIGITSAVRHSLEITAGSSGKEPRPSRDVVIDLVINAGGVLILVVALWLIRQQSRPADDKPGLLVGEAEE